MSQIDLSKTLQIEVIAVSIPLPPHTHCQNCNSPIPDDMKYCSDECKVAYEGKIKKERKHLIILYVVAILVVVIVGVISYLMA